MIWLCQLQRKQGIYTFLLNLSLFWLLWICLFRTRSFRTLLILLIASLLFFPSFFLLTCFHLLLSPSSVLSWDVIKTNKSVKNDVHKWTSQGVFVVCSSKIVSGGKWFGERAIDLSLNCVSPLQCAFVSINTQWAFPIPRSHIRAFSQPRMRWLTVCMHWSMSSCIRDLSMWGLSYPCGPWNQSPKDTEGWL